MIARRRVLVVEDEMLIAMEMTDTLTELGYDPVGPAMHLQRAIELAKTADLNLAILDVNLGEGTQAFPVAEVLSSRGIPFVFATGYGRAGVPARYSEVQVLNKPLGPGELARALERISRPAR